MKKEVKISEQQTKQSHFSNINNSYILKDYFETSDYCGQHRLNKILIVFYSLPSPSSVNFVDSKWHLLLLWLSIQPTIIYFSPLM